MPKFTVVLHAAGDENDEYFDQQNNVVPKSRQGIWTDFNLAAKAALRATTQDLNGRKATVREI